MAKLFLCLNLLCGLTTVIACASECTSYVIKPSQSQSCPDDRYSSATACVDNELTLSQFVNNSSDYLTNDSTLIFSPGNYSLESELVVENVHSFSMFAWPASSSKIVITCGHNARFAFRNISIVTVSGLEFVGCFENHVVSVGQFQLENSGFFGNGQPLVNGRVLSIEESTASLNRVAYVSVIDKPLTIQVLELPYHSYNCTELAQIFSTMDRAIGISLTKSSISITQSWFEGNNVGPIGRVIYDEFGSDITIVNTTFINNSAGDFTCYCCNNFTSGIVYANGHGNTVKIYASKFVQNVGVLIFGDNCNVLITHTKFINNDINCTFYAAAVYVTHTNLTISHSTFTNNKGASLVQTLYGGITSIDHSKFINNTGSWILHATTTSTISVTHSKFLFNNGGLRMCDGVITSIDHSKFINNTGSWILHATTTSTISVTHSEFLFNKVGLKTRDGVITSIDHSKFINNTGSLILYAANTSTISVTHSEFLFNKGGLRTRDGVITSIDHSKFINNTGSWILYATNTSTISVTHSEFVDNIVTRSLLYLDGEMITLYLNEFINNNIDDFAVVQIPYYTSAENLTNNVFSDNSAAYEVYIPPFCRQDHDPSLYSSRCIECSENWHQDLIGIVIAACVAGIALVIFMLALNMTVAVGTLNGILFYANIVAANADTYFCHSCKETDFVPVPNIFISWLNLDIGFDICFINSTFNEDFNIYVYKDLLQLAFPAYVIILVIIVIVASEYSSKFAKIVGKGNPVAVLATLILLSYSKFFNAILTSFSLLYLQPAHGSRNLDIKRLRNVLTQDVEQSNDSDFKAAAYFLLIFSIFILFLCIIFTALVFSWQWLLRYQDKVIFKWVRYQKLHLFLEPYHVPYTAKHRYWTGLLLFVRVLLFLISVLNFSLDPRVELMAVIFIVGGLILLKGVTAKRIYKNWPLDVMETAIYFNLVAFSSLTWYNLDFGGNQVAVAYTSVMTIFTLLLGIIVFHVLRYTRLYKCSFVEKAFKWTSSKLLEKKPKERPPNNAPEELDGYQLERSAAGDQELPTITYSVVEINQPAQNQEENYTD